MNYKHVRFSFAARQPPFCLLIFCLSLNVNAQECDFQEVAAIKNITHLFTSGSLSGGVSFMDFDGDGWDDLTFGTVEGEPIEIYKNNQGQFEKVSLSGLDNTCEMKQVTWIDFDNDGDKDLYFTCAFNGVVLYENNGDFHFTDITTEMGLSLPQALSYGANWADFDKDGWLDLYITFYGGLRNQLFHNLAGAGFQNISVDANVDPTNKPSFCAVVFDYDLDGWDDIYLANDRSVENDMLRNLGQSTFEDTSEPSGTDIPMDAMGLTLLDMNGDGYFEIYISNSPEGNVLLFNNGDGTFEDITASSGTAFNSVGWGVNTLDIDNDALSDLYVSGSNIGTTTLSSALYRALDRESFEQTQYPGMVSDTVMSFSNAVGDFNRDGRTDIAVSNSGGFHSQLWENQCTNDNNWLRVQLEGTVSNRDAIGARVVAWCLGVPAYQYKLAGTSLMGQNAGYLHFGLGSFDAVDSLLVMWPSGITDRVVAPEINKIHHITEGTAAKALPVSFSRSTDNLCDGDHIDLSLNLKGRNFEVVWSDDTEGLSTTVDTDGDYKAQISTQDIVFTSEVTTINFDELPQVSYELTHFTSAEGGKIVINAEGDYTYRWNHDPSLTSGTAINLEPGVYSVKITNDSGCDITLNISILSEIITSIDNPLTQSIQYRLEAGRLYIDLPNDLVSKLEEAQVYNAQGRVLYQQDYLNPTQNSLTIPNIPGSELIIVRLQFQGQSMVKKFIFQN